MVEKLKLDIAPGLYLDMPPEQYYGSSALGSSKLKAFADSPLAYSKYEDMVDTPELSFGRAAHCYILEGVKAFNKQYTIMPNGMQRRGKDYTSLVEKSMGKDLIKQQDFDRMIEMKDALMESDACKILKKPGMVEVSLFWEHNGIKCKGRLDKLVKGKSIDLMIDYKTCASAEEYKCMRSMEDYKYWLQEAHYGTGYHKVTGRDIEAIFIFQEKKSPYDVCLVKMSDSASPVAYKRWEDLMDSLAGCIKSKKFPGRNAGKGVVEWGFKEWGFQEEE
jgi:hypothetical protein